MDEADSEEAMDEADSEEMAEDGEMMVTYGESPMLAEMVADGGLPPVHERLPVNPRILPVYEEIGQYEGGTLRRAYNGISDLWGPPS